MYKRGTKGLAAALSLTMVLSPVMPVAQAYAEEATAAASEDAIEVVEGGAANDAIDPAADNGAEATPANDQQPVDNQQPADDQQPADTNDGAISDKDNDENAARTEGEENPTSQENADTYDFSQMKFKPWMILKGEFVMCIDIENLPEGTSPEDYTVKYWLGDDETRASTKNLADEDGKSLELLDCPAMRMVEQVHMRVYCKNVDKPIKSLDWSARDYFLALHKDRRQSKEMRHLAAAVLQYGSAAQRYYVYRTDDLADAGINEPMACEPIPENFKRIEYGRTEVASGITPSISFEESPDLVFHIHSENRFSAATMVIRVDDTLVTYNRWNYDPDTKVFYVIEPIDENNFNLRIANIRPQLLDHTFKIRIGSQRAFDTTDNPSVKFGQTPYLTIEYSPLSYAYEKQNEYGYEDICHAFYNYNLAAKQVSK